MTHSSNDISGRDDGWTRKDDGWTRRDEQEFEKELSELLHKVINLDGEFVLDGRYMKWGRIEKQIRELHRKHVAAERARSAVLVKGIDEALYWAEMSEDDPDIAVIETLKNALKAYGGEG